MSKIADDLKQRLRSNFPTTQAQFEAANRIEQLEAERNNAYKIADHYRVERDELKAAIENFLCAWDSCRSSGEWPVRRLEELRAATAKGEKT